MIGSAIRDYVPIAAARDTFREVARAYGLYGASEKVKLAETDDTHGLNKQLREAAAGWLAAWLNPGRVSSEGQVSGEQPDDVLPEQDLRCTKTGQVATSLDPVSVLTMNQSYARQVAPNRDVPRTPEENLSFRTEIVRQVQFITKMGPPQRETGIHVPDSVFDPVSFPRGDAIVVSDTGRDDPLIRRSIIHPLISAGYRVSLARDRPAAVGSARERLAGRGLEAYDAPEVAGRWRGSGGVGGVACRRYRAAD
jgi:hypothetical protein